MIKTIRVAQSRLSIAVLCLGLGCASNTFTETNPLQSRNPATHDANSKGSNGKQQKGHYNHQQDTDEAMGYTLGQCQVCLEDVTDLDIAAHKAYACFENHCVDKHCLSHQVKSLEIHGLDQVKELQNRGLSCCGDGGKCKERIALETVEDLLEPTDREDLKQRLTKIEKSAKSGLDARAEREVIALSHGVEGAFNLCCPANGCGSTLDKIEGCNAATCSDERCKATFCYLCLKPQENSQAAHAHARGHSGDYWEYRPGFTERYHWQISRKEIAVFFKGKIDPKVRKAALEPHKALLEEKNLWPLPAGMRTEDWIKEVEATPESTRKYFVYEDHGKERVEKTEPLHTKDKKIELLQNEYIFLTHEGDKKNAELVKSALQGMGGQVFASLDVRDVAQPAVPAADRVQAQNGGHQVLGGNHPLAVQPLAENERLHPVQGDERVQVFVALGEQYRVGNLIWSSTPHGQVRVRRRFLGIGARRRVEEIVGDGVRKMNWDAANRFCRNLGDGARLPTRGEYTALSRAMGYPNNYRAEIIADMRENWFWSSSVHGGGYDYYYLFYGNYGGIGEALKSVGGGAVRCVRGR